jgi:hypothetical protein
MAYRDNFPEVDRSLARLERDMSTQTLTMENNMEYAEHLQNKSGYYVFSDGVSVAEVKSGLQATARVLPLTRQNVARTLEKAGFDLVAFYRSITSELRPPVRAGEGMRHAHPGHWADITGNLASSYRFTVNAGAWKGEQTQPEPGKGARVR